MDTFLADLSKHYFHESLVHSLAPGSSFVDVERSADDAAAIGMNSDGTAGRIIYKEADQVCRSKVVYFKYHFDEEARASDSRSVLLFDREIYFFTRVAPFFDSLRSVRHLIAAFLDHRKQIDVSGVKVALLFEHFAAAGYANAGYRSLLDQPHLSLMMRGIGEFHAYSFAAKKMAAARLVSLSTLSVDEAAAVSKPFIDGAVATLHRGVKPLRTDARYREAVPRIENLLNSFGESMVKARIGDWSGQCSVVAHRSYNQSNVIFKYVDGNPVHMKILDWQTFTCASLAADILLPLYLEASHTLRRRCWHPLLDDYYAALSTTFDDVVVPSKQTIFEELKTCVAVVLFAAAYRVNQNHIKKDSDHLTATSREIWNVEWVTEILKDMIDRNLI